MKYNVNILIIHKIQIEKLLLLEDFTKTYDEVLYLDFDVIPVTDVSFFERFDLNYLCFHEVVKDMLSIQYEKLKNDVNFTKFSSALFSCSFELLDLSSKVISLKD